MGNDITLEKMLDTILRVQVENKAMIQMVADKVGVDFSNPKTAMEYNEKLSSVYLSLFPEKK